jgi:hypothetical protein
LYSRLSFVFNDLLFPGGTLKAAPVNDPYLLPLHGNDPGLPEFTQGFRGGFAINVQIFRNVFVRHVLNTVSVRSLQQ